MATVRDNRSSRAATLMLLAALLAAAARPAAAALFAVDLGTEFLKVSVVKPGRIPISIVINEMSKRKTPALVGFVGGDRLVGEEAASLAARHPDKIISHLRDLLGRPADHGRLRALRQISRLSYPLQAAANRSWAAAVPTGGGKEGPAYSAEELVASLLEYARRLAVAAADGAPVNDAVLVVPPFFTPQQRQSLLDAAKLAGVNVMGLVHSHAAAALQYGIERDFTNRTEDVVLYDLGASAAVAALVRYSSYPEGRAGKSISQFEVRDVAWAEGTGGDELEAVLVEHFAQEFNAKLGSGKDVRDSPKAMAKLRKQVKRTKQILSANTEAPLSVEELFEDRDFRSSISRDKFEELAGDFWARAAAPVAALLARNNVSAGDLAAVELLGGTSRVPRVKAALSEALGARQLDMHLDADEAVVLGAGLFAANLSTTFRLRKFGMTDKVPYSVHFRLGGDEEAPEKLLVPALKRMPTKRGIYQTNLTTDAFSVTLTFDNAPGAVAPADRQTFELGRWTVSGVEGVVAKYNESGKVGLHARVDSSGVFHIDRADAAIEVIEVLPAPDANATAAANETAATDGKAEEAGADGKKGGKKDNKVKGAEKGKAKEAAAGKPDPASAAAAEAAAAAAARVVRRTLRLPLNVTGGLTAPGLTPEQLAAGRRVLRALREADEAKRETAKAKNDLESYIIGTRDKLESDEVLRGVTTEEQRSAFQSQLTDAEDWLYGDGDAASAREYRDRLRALREVGDPMAMRAAETTARPQVVKAATELQELIRKAAGGWSSAKPWIPANDTAELLAKVDEFASWLGEKQGEQAKLAPYEEPAFRSEQVEAWAFRLQKAFTRLDSRRKPPAPKPPAPKAAGGAKGGNETEVAGGKSEDKAEAEAAGSDGVQQEAQAESEAADSGSKPEAPETEDNGGSKTGAEEAAADDGEAAEANSGRDEEGHDEL